MVHAPHDPLHGGFFDASKQSVGTLKEEDAFLDLVVVNQTTPDHKKEIPMNELEKRILFTIATILIVVGIALSLELSHPRILHKIAKGFQEGRCAAFAYALCP